MPRVVVAGSENDTHIAIIDFTNAGAPTVVLVDPGFAAGCRVTINGSKVATASVLTGAVRLVDASNPAAPVLQGNINTVLAGIGAIAMRGSRVAVGEFVNAFQARVILIDFSNPMAPSIIGTASTSLASGGSTAIGSIAFLNDNVVFASGPSDFQIVQVDFTNPMAPVVTNFNPTLAGPPVIDLDASAARLTAGDTTSGILKLFDANTKALIASKNTMLNGITSASIANPLVLVASSNQINAARVDFSGVATVTSFNPGLGGGSTTAIEGTIGACGAILGTQVALINLAGGPPTVLGTANANIPSISTLAISTFAAVMNPQVTVTPVSLAFQAVRVGSSKMLPLTIKNTGGGSLRVTNLQSSNPRFTFNPPGPFTLGPNASAVVNVTFSPNAEVAFNGNLTMSTNDPLHPNVTVLLSGQGALPHISLSTNSLNLGNVAVCLFNTASVIITNSGSVPLTVSGIATSGPPFTSSPPNLVVGPGASQTVLVRFTPSIVGQVNGTLTITSDDQANPTLTVALSGNGTPTPPPAISVTPAALNFGATPLQFYIGLRVTVANTSPCQPLAVTLNSSGAPFFVTDVDPTTLPPVTVAVNGTVPANTSKRFVVAFAPTALGATNGTLTINSNDPLNPVVTIPLTGTGVQLNPAALVLVLDRSGSMSAPAQGGTKMDGLKAAVHLFADLVIPGQGDEMGSVQFDDAFNVLTPIGSYDAPKRTLIEADADTLTPRNFTSIGGGLQLGQTQLAGAASPRKVILVFTDGLQNTPPDIATAEPLILAAGTEVYAVGLGQPQNISVPDLSALAASSNGRFFLTDDTLILRKNFVQVLADAFRQNMAADPIITLNAGQTVNIPVNITECERRITFVLNWDDPASQLAMTVRAPDGTVFSPTSPLSNQLVRYGQRSGYRYYQIAFPPVDPGSGIVIGPPQIGQWLMRVQAIALAGATQRCTTSVIVESQLELRAIVHAVDVNTPIQIQAQILQAGTPVKDATVVVAITQPLKSLAQVSTPAVVQKALHADKHPIPTGSKPLIPTKTVKHPLVAPKNERQFTLQLPPPGIDGVYQFEFQARGKACGGIFDRYRQFSVYIGKRPDGRKTAVTVAPSSPNSAIVTVVPKDSQDKPLGPGHASTIKPKLTGGTVYGVVDRCDGSYSFRATWRPKRKPRTLKIAVGEMAIEMPLGRKKR